MPKERERDSQVDFEEVVLILKPGVALTHFKSRLEDFLNKKGLVVVQSKEIIFSEDLVRQFYPHSPEKYIPETAAYLTTGKVIALHIKGKDAIAICSKLKRRLRGYFKLKRPADMFHCSGEGRADEYDKAEVAREKEFLGFS